MLNTLLYENYHSSVRKQHKVIENDDFTYQHLISFIEKYIPYNGKILDIGSATGTLSIYFASLGLTVDGLELSKNAINIANINKKILKIKNVTFLNDSIEEFVTHKKYDLIVCFEVLEHIQDDKKCLIKISKLLVDHGVLAISVPSKNAPLFKMGLLTKFDKKVGHLRRYSLFEIKNLLNSIGIRVIDVKKSEGLLRNILYTNKIMGYFIKLMKIKIIKHIFNLLDQITRVLFGESQVILICRKK